MQRSAVIRTTDLSKHFGSVRALDGLNIEVHRGEVFGFLGPNGAGKSTAIRVLLDLIRPTSGEAHVFGNRPADHGPEQRARIGYLPGELRLPEQLSAGRYLWYLTRLRQGQGDAQVAALAERFGLDLGRQIGKLSKGNKQKIGLVQAFMHQPELLILDEPTSGLDPLLQHEFQALVHEQCDAGATVFMSSHVLSEIEDVADRVGIIRRGKLVDIDELHVLRHKAGQSVVLRVVAPVDEAALGAVRGLAEMQVEHDEVNGESVVTAVLRGSPDALIKVAARHEVRDLQIADRELEDLFLDFYRG